MTKKTKKSSRQWADNHARFAKSQKQAAKTQSRRARRRAFAHMAVTPIKLGATDGTIKE